MDFTALKTRVAQETGMDLTVDDSIVGAWVNAAYKQINGAFNWPWLFKVGTIQTVADITTGTVSVTAGSSTVTFTSAPAMSVANQYMIQFPATSNDWYTVSSHTAAATTATLSVPFVGSASITGASYILRKVYYSLPSDMDRLIDIRQAITYTKLGAADIRALDRYLPNPTATGSPLIYSMTGMDTSKYWQITLYPTPNTIENLQLRYLQVPADLSTSTDTPMIPEKFHPLIVYGALYMFGHDFIDDTRVKSAKSRYDDAMEEMLLNYSPVPDQLLALQPWDSRPRRMVGRLSWPPDYPNGRF